MVISKTGEIAGRRIVSAIGRIQAASGWHASGTESADWKGLALAKLVSAAEEFEADAIVEVDFAVDGVAIDDLAAPLERVCAKGVAVRLARS